MNDLSETVMLEIDRGELSALCYLIAFAAMNHPKLTQHEESLVNKISKLDEYSFQMWRTKMVQGMIANRINTNKVREASD
jgi:hypothetical protein